jgi:hypothetical protein
MERTGFLDANGEIIYGGQAIEFWDDEGGHGVGITTLHPKHGWLMLNPSKDLREDGTVWSIASISSFAPKSCRLMVYGKSKDYL